jgi:sarcosine oxidase, subunit delta
MMQLNCPWCGMRDEPEFICGGTSHIVRPAQDTNDKAWGEYLFFRENPKGVHLERWNHAYGCGEWFNVARNTVTHEILSVYRMGESAP